MPTRRRRFTNPFRGVKDTVSEMNRISDRMTGTDAVSTPQQERTYTDAWSPATDILADGGDVLIRCELPGVDSEDLEVTLSRGTLTIAGQRRPDNASDEDYLVRERFAGQFRRDIELPVGVEDEDIDADFSEGVLLVRVRGSAAAPGPAQISVRSQKAEE